MESKAILSVEDDRESLNALRLQLDRHFGDEYLLEFSQSVDEAVAVLDDLIAREVNVILLLSDWYMPGKNADVLVDYIKSKNPLVRVIVLSGQLDVAKASQMLEGQIIDRIIMKPWDEAILVNQIKTFLAQ